MAIVSNKVTQAGNVLTINSNYPAVGLLTLSGFVDNVTGETVDTYFIREFRYSLDGGITYSDWIELTLPNIQAVAVDPKDILKLQYKYKKVGPNAQNLEFVSNLITTTNAAQTCGYYFNKSLFSKYLDCNDVDTLNWYVNVTEKLYKTQNIARYVGRLNELESPEDFLILWRWISKYFGYFVTLARKFQFFFENETLLREFLTVRGIKIANNNTLLELIQLMSEFKHQISLRGSVHIYDKKFPDRDWQEGSQINGELIRFINYINTDEFIYIQHLPENLGWKIDRSSPNYRGLPFEINANKIYEPNGITNIQRWPTDGRLTLDGEIELLTGERINAGYGCGAEKYIKVDEMLDYEFSFDIKVSGSFSFGLSGYNNLGAQINLLSAKTGTTSNIFADNITVMRSDKFVRVRGVLYNRNRPIFSEDRINLNVGNNLKSVAGLIKIVPFVGNITGSAYLKNFVFRPLLTAYSRGFLQNKNFISAFIKNRSIEETLEAEKWISKYLTPYDATIKVNNIGDWAYTDPGFPHIPIPPTYAWAPYDFTCDYANINLSSIGGVTIVTTLFEYNVATGAATGAIKPNSIGDPDYIAPIESTYCPVFRNQRQVEVFTKNDCGEDLVGTDVPFIVPANSFIAPTLAQANQLALDYIAAHGQEFANNNGQCVAPQLYYNVKQQQRFTKDNCGTGLAGTSVLYVVEAGTHSSLISQATADALALQDILDNGQQYANDHGACRMITYSYKWIIDETASYCEQAIEDAFITLRAVAADPQSGEFNLYAFSLRSSVPLAVDISVVFNATYLLSDGSEQTHTAASITLPAGQTVKETGFEITDASPLSPLPVVTITSSTPLNGAVVLDEDGNEVTLIINVENN